MRDHLVSTPLPPPDSHQQPTRFTILDPIMSNPALEQHRRGSRANFRLSKPPAPKSSEGSSKGKKRVLSLPQVPQRLNLSPAATSNNASISQSPLSGASRRASPLQGSTSVRSLYSSPNLPGSMSFYPHLWAYSPDNFLSQEITRFAILCPSWGWIMDEAVSTVISALGQRDFFPGDMTMLVGRCLRVALQGRPVNQPLETGE